MSHEQAKNGMSELLYINSRYRAQGTPGDFTVAVPNSMLCVRGNRMQRMKVTVLDAVINRCWYTVQESNNTFWVSTHDATTTYDLPPGYHTALTLRALIAALLPAWAVGWAKDTNKLTLVPPDDGRAYTLGFDDASCELFGFPPGATPAGTHARPIVSAQPIKVNRESALLVHTDIPRAENSVVDNVLQPQFVESDILIKIPVTCAPFDNVVFSASSGDLYSFVTTSTNINSIRFWVTDELGRALDLPYDWTLTLRVDYLGEPDANASNASSASLPEDVAKIRDYLHLLLLNDQNLSQ